MSESSHPLSASIPTTRPGKWLWLTRFLEEWCPSPERFSMSGISAPIKEADLDGAEQRIDCRIPIAVREWYRWFGNRTDIWNAQDRLLPPDLLRIDGGLLVFLDECQGVVQWGIPLDEVDQGDPSVTLDMGDLSDEQLTESSSFSEFAVALALYDFKFVSDHAASGSAAIRSESSLKEAFGNSVLTPWHWPVFPTVIFLEDESVLEIQTQYRESSWISLASKSEESFQSSMEKLASMGIVLMRNG